MNAFACGEHEDAPLISSAHRSLQSVWSAPHRPFRSQIAPHASSTEGRSPGDVAEDEEGDGEGGGVPVKGGDADVDPDGDDDGGGGEDDESSPLPLKPPPRSSPAIFPPHAVPARGSRATTSETAMETNEAEVRRMRLTRRWPRGARSVTHRNMRKRVMASPAGLGPATPNLGNSCSIQLSYGDLDAIAL